MQEGDLLARAMSLAPAGAAMPSADLGPALSNLDGAAAVIAALAAQKILTAGDLVDWTVQVPSLHLPSSFAAKRRATPFLRRRVCETHC